MPVEAAEREDDVQQPAVEEPTKLVIDVSDPDPDDDEGPGKSATPELDRAGRRAHYRELKKSHEDLKAKYEALEKRLSEEPQRQQQREEPARPSDPPELAPIRARLAELESIEDALMAQAASTQLTPEQAKDINARYRRVKREEQALIARGVGIQQRHSQPQPDHSAEAAGVMLRSQFPEIYANRALFARADGEYRALLASGKPETVETMTRALTTIRNQYVKKAPAATDTDRARLASVTARAGASGSQGGWTPSKMHERTAVAWAQAKGMDVEPAEALRLWALKIGKPKNLI